MQLNSPAFKKQSPIPIRYTGEGEDVSPPLEWSDIPKGCERFALLCQDPDAPMRVGGDHPFVHWVIYNISPTTSYLPEGLPKDPSIELPVLATQGRNSFGQIGYNGPMPPRGHGVHRYEFTLFALSENFRLTPGIRKGALLEIIEGFVLAKASLIGTYERKNIDTKKSA